MRIAIISTMNAAPWGGSEELWAAAADAALDAGHQVAVSVFRWPILPDRLRELSARSGFTLHRRIRPRLGAYSKYLYVPYNPFKGLAKYRPDVILFSQGGAHYTGLSGERRVIESLLEDSGIPYVVVCHGFAEWDIPPTADARSASRRNMLGAHKVCFVAERMRLIAEHHVAATIPNALIVQNPVNLKDVTPLSWPEMPQVRMANVARHDNLKGIDLLMEILAASQWKSRDWRLDLWGDGPLHDYLHELRRYFGLDDRINLPGPSRDIRSVWAENHLLVFPSRTEGVPLALVEAMLCGRPSVVTDVGGIREWVDDGHTAFIAEASTPASFGRTMERAWDERDRWPRMGALARETAKARTGADPGTELLRILESAVKK